MPIDKINKSKEQQYKDFAKMVELRGGKYCNKCFDRGFNGYDTKLEMFIPCECILKHGMELTKKMLAEKKLNELEVENG
jgi:hypothetical protein